MKSLIKMVVAFFKAFIILTVLTIFSLYLFWLIFGITIEVYGSYPNGNGKIAYLYREDRGMLGPVEGETKVIILDWYTPFIPRLFRYEKNEVVFSEGYYSGHVKWNSYKEMTIYLDPFNNSSSDDEYFAKEYEGIKINYQFGISLQK
jgi:hypothetical protein